MRHQGIAVLKPHNTDREIQMPISADISKFSEYGNGMSLALKFGDADWTSWEIRYDTEYDAGNEEGYIETFLRKHVWIPGHVTMQLVRVDWKPETVTEPTTLEVVNRLLRMYRRNMMSFRETFDAITKELIGWRCEHPDRISDEDVAKVMLDSSRKFDWLMR